MKNRMIGGLLALALTASCLLCPTAAQAAVGKADHTTVDLTQTSDWPEAPEIGAGSAYVIELNSGTVLYDKNGETQVYPASTTKTMTAYLALQNLNLSQEITFSQTAVTFNEDGASHTEFQAGEVLSVDETLQFLMCESVNECANALAEATSGSIPTFVDLMNQTAAEFGCTNTHFNNASGLTDEDHYTTARDMAMIQWGVIQDERFQQYASIRHISIKGRAIRTSGFTSYYNHHLMLLPDSQYYDSRVVCGKTGHTSAAGGTLVTYAKSGDMDVVVVIMQGDDTQRFIDTENLLDYAFDNFEVLSPEEAAELVTNNVDYALDPGTETVGDGDILVPVGTAAEHITSDFTAGTSTDDANMIGTRNWYYDGTQVGSSSVRITDEAIQQLSERADAEKTAKNDAKYKAGAARSNLDLVVFALLVVVLLVLLFLLTRLILANIRRKKAAKRRAEMRRARRERELRARRAAEEAAKKSGEGDTTEIGKKPVEGDTIEIGKKTGEGDTIEIGKKPGEGEAAEIGKKPGEGEAAESGKNIGKGGVAEGGMKSVEGQAAEAGKKPVKGTTAESGQKSAEGEAAADGRKSGKTSESSKRTSADRGNSAAERRSTSGSRKPHAKKKGLLGLFGGKSSDESTSGNRRTKAESDSTSSGSRRTKANGKTVRADAGKKMVNADSRAKSNVSDSVDDDQDFLSVSIPSARNSAGSDTLRVAPSVALKGSGSISSDPAKLKKAAEARAKHEAEFDPYEEK